MLFRAGTIAVLTAALLGAGGGMASAAGPPQLRFAPPELQAPETIEVGLDDTRLQLDPAKDYVLKLPAERKTTPTWIDGGRNVAVLGGHLSIAPGTGDANLAISGTTGTVHVEGLLIDGSARQPADGIVIDAPQALVQLQNIRVFRLRGARPKGPHTDIVELRGNVRELRIDRMTATTGHRGLNVRPLSIGPRPIMRLSNIELAYAGAGYRRAGDLLRLDTGCESAVTNLDRVFVTTGAKAFGGAVHPGTRGSCRAKRTKRALAFPKLPVNGVVRRGKPRGGQFVPEGMAGPGYVSPGYLGVGLVELLPPPPPPPPVATLDPLDPATLLRWAPPVLTSPQEIAVGPTRQEVKLDAGKDYVLKMPATKKVGQLHVTGGRNVVLMGGHVTVAAGGGFSALHIKDHTGTFHVEGLLIDGSGGREGDGITISAPEGIVQIQNTRVEGMRGSLDGTHADVIQPTRGVKELRLDVFTGTTNYQGLFLRPDLGPIGRIELHRTNIRYDKVGAKQGGDLLWLDTDCEMARTVLRDVYLGPLKSDADGAIHPSNDTPNCPAKITLPTASFPRSPVDGIVRFGVPTSGDFVPEGTAGIGYVAPGYLGR